MSEDLVHNIFYQHDGEELAQRLKDYCAGRRYKVKFNLHKLQNTNFTNLKSQISSTLCVSILLLTPELCDFIRCGRHFDLNVLFPNPDFSIAILFHVEKTTDEIASFLQSTIRNIHEWKILEFKADSGLTSIVIDIMDVIEKLERKSKSDPILQKFRVWMHEGVKPHQQVILIFTEPIDDEAQVRVIQEWNGLTVAAECLNPMTYAFSLGDAEPGDKSIEVYVNDTAYGKAALRVRHMEPKMEQVFQFLNNFTNPIEVLCRCLNIVPITRDNLDKKLVDLLSKNSSAVSNIFEEFNWEKYGDSESKLELPTLLHFGAKFGLRLFCLELLKFPGGQHALKIKNKDRLLPRQIAQKEGFDHVLLSLQKHGKEDLYAKPKLVEEFEDNDPIVIQRCPGPLANRNMVFAVAESMREIGSPYMKQPNSSASNTTLDRPRFYSGGTIEEESPARFDDFQSALEEQRLNRTMTKVTANRGKEEKQTRKRNNSLPEVPALGRITRKEHPYEELK